MIGFILSIVFTLFVLAILGAAGVTAWWLWRRATLADGEPVPKWGDLRSLVAALRGLSIVLRMMAVAVLAGLMMIPMGFISELVDGRYFLYRNVVSEISSSWGSEQTLSGPVLHVPYIVKYQTSEEVPLTAAELALEQSRGGGRTTREVVVNHEEQYAAVILPEELSIDGQISTDTRKRGIYSARVYTADALVSGSFAKRDVTGLRQHIAEVRWDEAMIVVGVTSTKAIRDISEISVAGAKYKFLPGSGGLKMLPTGFSAPCDLSGLRDGEAFNFDFRLSLGGSDRFFMTPVGVTNDFKISSDWPHPNFTGSGLPSSREIRADGFAAEWNVPNLVRNYPQTGNADAWATVSAYGSQSRYYGDDESRSSSAGAHNLGEYVMGVEFFEPVFHYSLITRAVKYGLLFIALTFLGIVIFENYYGKRGGAALSMAQYAVIGVGLALFYLTLLAASEHIGFTAAYFVASAQGVLMTSCYVAAAIRKLRPAVLTAVTQSLLYALLFFILRMEDHALLAGTALFVAATAALMAVTRNINRPGSE